jgi:superfamily II DNA or RNA helicase
MTVIAPPEQGQLVDVRNRRCVVTEVQQATQRDGALTSGRHAEPQHLVTLSSVEDDGLGEEFQVVWELEPGARAYEKAELPAPTGFDDPRRLDAFLDAVKWGAASTADVRTLQSPFRSGIEIEDYQLDPAVRAIQMPRVSLLIADDVGLGKTIESGLVCQELIFRHAARRVLIVCPSSLQIQWQEQMRDKFGLEFRIVDSQMMKLLRRTRGIHTNPWTHFPRLITSIDFLKRERPLRSFRELLPAEGEPRYPRRFDLLIVDEAHNVAPSGGGNYATDSLRTSAIRLLVPHFEHKLFLTATPHNGYPESFTALLELLDAQRFARGVAPDRNQLQTIMVRRLKSDLPPRWDGSARFPKRKLEAIPVPYTAEEREAHARLREYTALRRKGAVDGTEKYATEFVLKLLKKRLFSSPAAFAATLEKHEDSVNSARRRGRHSTAPKPMEGLLRRQLTQQVEEDYVYEEATTDALASATRLFRELSGEESRLLRELREWAGRSASRPDSKAAELLRWLRARIKPNGKWSDERVLIFTEYRATQNWLHQLLITEGVADGERLMTLYGGMDAQERERVKAAFQAAPADSPVRILLATDAASEGLDLQNHCSRLIHYEIPWNPNRMEQRNGRIDRYGQKASETLIYHFVGSGYDEHKDILNVRPGDLDDDLEFLMRAARKVETIREDLGKVGPVIAQQVEEAMLGRNVRLDTAAAERDSEPVRRLLRFNIKVTEQIERLREQFQETKRSLRLSPENVQSVVAIGLELAVQPALIETDVPGLGGPAFHAPAFKGSWAECTNGLAHPHTGTMRPVVFDGDLARGRDDVVLVHLNHRLVQMCLRLLRAEVWSNDARKRLHRVAARVVPNSALEFPAVVAYGRLVVLGGDQQRLHEEVITAGGTLREGRFSRMNVGDTQRALDEATTEEAPDWLKGRLAELWPKYENSLMQSLEARMRDRTDGLQKALQERADKEVANITAVLEELQRSILEELKEPEIDLQLELFNDTERDQLERNLSSLRARVEQIPQEIEMEAATIRGRFRDPVPRLFPLAVTFLIPQKIARGGKF